MVGAAIFFVEVSVEDSAWDLRGFQMDLEWPYFVYAFVVVAVVLTFQTTRSFLVVCAINIFLFRFFAFSSSLATGQL